jgi:DNA-binding LacI/PurR family transcriptional regulator
MTDGGTGRVTMAEVARGAGVSAMTVSYSYNQPDRVAPATRTKVMRVAAELGYRGPDPTARSLRRRRTGAIGVVLGEHLAYAFEDPQARSFLTGVAEVCRELGIGLNLIPTTGRDDDVDRVRTASVDGYIVWTTVDSDPVLGFLGGLDRPVAVHGGPAISGAGVVSIDNRASARAVAALTLRGAARPSVLSFPFGRDQLATVAVGPDADDVDFPVTRDRLLGIYDACRDLGIDPLTLPVAVVARNDRTDAAGMVGALLDSNTDAVVAMSDQLAFAVLDEADRRGLRVPGDLAVSGWDDDPDATRRGLTTVAQSLFDQGRSCALLAVGEALPDAEAEWTVSVRSSTRPE